MTGADSCLSIVLAPEASFELGNEYHDQLAGYRSLSCSRYAIDIVRRFDFELLLWPPGSQDCPLQLASSPNLCSLLIQQRLPLDICNPTPRKLVNLPSNDFQREVPDSLNRFPEIYFHANLPHPLQCFAGVVKFGLLRMCSCPKIPDMH